MKKLLMAGVAIAALSTSAMAADLPARSAPSAPVYAAPLFTWTGFYVGVNAGYGFGDSGNDNGVFIGPTFFPSVGRDNSDGFVGGGQIGYNQQVNNFVFGIEADLQYADLGRDESLGFIAPPGVYVSGSRGIEWFGTVRGRLGVAFDRFLVYATGGLAYGGGDDSSSFGFVANGNDDVEFGWTLGGGAEYAFTNNLTFRVEGLYVNIDRGNANGFVVSPAGVVTPVGGSTGEDGFGVVRAGLNWKF